MLLLLPFWPLDFPSLQPVRSLRLPTISRQRLRLPCKSSISIRASLIRLLLIMKLLIRSRSMPRIV